MSEKRCPSCGYQGPYKRAVCPNCGLRSGGGDVKPPLLLRLILGVIMFGLGAFGTCIGVYSFLGFLGPLILPLIVIGGAFIAYGTDRSLFMIRPLKHEVPDNDIRLAPPEDRRDSDSSGKGDK